MEDGVGANALTVFAEKSFHLIRMGKMKRQILVSFLFLALISCTDSKSSSTTDTTTTAAESTPAPTAAPDPQVRAAEMAKIQPIIDQLNAAPDCTGCMGKPSINDADTTLTIPVDADKISTDQDQSRIEQTFRAVYAQVHKDAHHGDTSTELEINVVDLAGHDLKMDVFHSK